MAERFGLRRLAPTAFAARAGLFFAAAVLAMYWPVLKGDTPLPTELLLQFPPWSSMFDGTLDPMSELGDLITQFYPYRAFSGAYFRDGVMPLWNPHVYAGAPYQANPLSAIFAPATLIHAFVPSPLAWGLGFMLRAFVAGLFTTLFLKELKASASGALAGGVAFGFAGFVLAWQGWPQADSACWLPLVCLAVIRLRRSPAPATLAMASVVFTLPLFGGHPGIALYVIAYALAFAVYCFAAPDPDGPTATRGRFVFFMVAAGGLALGVAAVQLLPTMEWIGQTDRSPADLQIGRWHRPAREIVSFLCRDASANPNFAGILVPEALTYSGALTVVAAFLSPLFSRWRHSAFFALLLLLSVQVVYGWGPMFWVTSHTPGVAAFNNWRVIVTACFSLAVLGGLGVSAVQERASSSDSRGTRWWWVLVVAAAIACGGALWVLQGPMLVLPVFAPYAPAAIVSAAVLAALSALLFCPPVARGLGARAVGVAAVALLSFDLYTFGYGHVPFAPPDEVFPRPDVYRHLKRLDRGVYRIVSIDNTMPKNVEAMPYGMYSPTGYDYVLRRALHVLTPLTANVLNPDFKPAVIVEDDSRLLDLLNVKYLLANEYHPGAQQLASRPDRFREVLRNGTVRVFENLRVLPRAFVVPRSGVEVEPGESRTRARLGSRGFDPAVAVLVPEAPAWPAGGAPAPAAGDGAEIVSLSLNEARMTVSASTDAVLVFTDVYYPGWRVWVDGRESPLLRTDHAFKGVALPPGAHDVRFAFVPWRYRVGGIVSCVTVLILAGVVVVDRRRRRRAVPGPAAA